MEGSSEEFTSMPDVPAENESFGQRIRNFLWDNKKYIFLTGCFAASVSVVLVVYMMRQRPEHIEVLEEYTEPKAKHNTLLRKLLRTTSKKLLTRLKNIVRNGN